MGVILYFDISKYRSKEIAQVLLMAANTARLAVRMKGLLKEWIHHFFHQTSPDAAREYPALFGAG